MEDFIALGVAADQFEMTEDELHGLIRAGTIRGVRIPDSGGIMGGWMIDRASLAAFSRGNPAPTNNDPPPTAATCPDITVGPEPLPAVRVLASSLVSGYLRRNRSSL